MERITLIWPEQQEVVSAERLALQATMKRAQEQWEWEQQAPERLEARRQMMAQSMKRWGWRLVFVLYAIWFVALVYKPYS